MKNVLFPSVVVLSGALHFGIAGIGNAVSDPILDGGPVDGDVALGLGFADLVAGATSASPVKSTPQTPMKSTPAVEPLETPAKTLPPMKTTSHKPEATHSVKTNVAANAPIKTSSVSAPTPATIKPQKANEPIKAKKPPAKPKPAAPSKKGNAAVNNTKGQTEGKKTGTVAEVAKTKAPSKSTKGGDGAIKSYQSTILRKIARVPKRSSGARGEALIGISITPSGTIASARVVKSSGHAGIDKLAVAQINRAGPFKPTPTGKTIKVVVRFQSKG